MKRALWAVPALFWFGVFVGWPIYMHNTPTARNVTVEVVRAPTADDRTVAYRWTGDIIRSCVVTLRRQIVSADGVVFFLEPLLNLPALSHDDMGERSRVIEFSVPNAVGPGPAYYTVSEVPDCDWTQEVMPIRFDYPPVHFIVPE